MERVLFDYTYYQGRGNYIGGGEEYGNVILDKLLGDKKLKHCGVFCYENKDIDYSEVLKIKEKGWKIHCIRDLRNISKVVRENKYSTLYSPLPYDTKWRGMNLPEQCRFIGTFHGLRTVETSLLYDDEIKFYNNEHVNDAKNIYVSEDEKKYKAITEYGMALNAFRNRKIIVVSEHTKFAMLYYYPDIRHEEIEVLYSPPKLLDFSWDIGYENKFLKSLDVEANKYGLIISADKYIKNPIRAIIAYDILFKKKLKVIPKEYKVVVIGYKNPERILERICNKDRFIFTNYVDSSELEILYKNAQLFVYPSFNEGFGYPPLEAMKYGTLCACSVNSSISEICRDMALYFNPYLIDEIAIRILQSFDDKIVKEKKANIKRSLPLVVERQRRDLKRLIEIIIGEAS